MRSLRSEIGDHFDGAGVIYRVNPPWSNEDMNALFAAAWDSCSRRDFGPVLDRSLAYVCAYYEERLIGFVNLAWDGGVHAFMLDPTVSPDIRRRGVGSRLVELAIEEAANRGVGWLHVDYEPRLRDFYERCGFRATEDGILRL